MNDTVIKIKQLGKQYRLGQRERYYALRDKIVRLLKFSKPKMRNSPSDSTYIWALKDVSFEVKRGEIIGIIGRNGAGKTTLLKILSRITEPTEGYAHICGRVGSLLEIGTGFHPELTGRENIYLNGAILGMKKLEINKKFDAIVSFAELEKFLDTPTKYYSSGMYVRLAFAVAAHLETEILLVDEVLAVGDMAFQKKCLGKMEDVVKEARTILFVSHNLGAIQQLCSRAILLNEGRLIKDAATQAVLNTYIEMISDTDTLKGDLTSPKLRLPQSDLHSLFKWRYIKIINSQKQQTSKILFHEPFELVFAGYADKKCKNTLVGCSFFSKVTGNIVFGTHQISNGLPDTLPQEISEFHVEINPNILAPGYYSIEIGALGPGVSDYIHDAFEFDIVNIGITNDYSWNPRYRSGVVDYPCRWKVENKSSFLSKLEDNSKARS